MKWRSADGRKAHAALAPGAIDGRGNADNSVRCAGSRVDHRTAARDRPDRTGYPIEYPRPDLDMEADLGIDSIKRVEILGKLRDEFRQPENLSDSAEVMDDLARARTLGEIVDRMATLGGRGGESDPRFPIRDSRSEIANPVPRFRPPIPELGSMTTDRKHRIPPRRQGKTRLGQGALRRVWKPSTPRCLENGSG